ncbi:CHAT domain-containing protein [Actinocorallia libanotica]|uniref:CHAT domain-containing protein n=1 Tax=Actinocorallia libanotica TaxID=46162 RepID=A0ABP4B1S8_9ACTN
MSVSEEPEAAVVRVLEAVARTGDVAEALEPAALDAACELLVAVAERTDLLRRPTAADRVSLERLALFHMARAQALIDAGDEREGGDAWGAAFAFVRLAGEEALRTEASWLLFQEAEGFRQLDDVGLLLGAVVLPGLRGLLAGRMRHLLPTLVALQRRSVEECRLEEHLPTFWLNLATVVRIDGFLRGDGAALEEAVHWSRRSVEAADPEDAVGRCVRLADLAFSLLHVAEAVDPKYAPETEQVARQALAAWVDDLPDPGLIHDVLGRALHLKAVFSGEHQVLSESLVHHRRAVELTPPGSPQREIRLLALADVLVAAEGAGLEADGIDTAMAAYEELISGLPEHADFPHWQHQMALALRARGHKNGSEEDFRAAADLLEEAITGLDPRAEGSAGARSLLAEWRSEDHGALGETDDPALIEQARAALASIPRTHFQWHVGARRLAELLTNRHRQTGDVAALDEAERLSREVLEAALAYGDPRSAGERKELCHVLLAQWHRTGEVAFVEEAAETMRPLLSPEEDADAHVLELYARSLHARYHHDNDARTLTAAIEAQRRAVLAASGENRALSRDFLGVLLNGRYLNTGSTADLDEAVRLGEEALSVLSEEYPGRRHLLFNLAERLQHRYRRTGAKDDIVQALELARAAALLPQDARTAGIHGHLTSLPITLVEHYRRTGDRALLAEAIDLLQSLLDRLPTAHRDRSALLSGLGYALLMRYMETGDDRDLAEAERFCRLSLEMTAPSSGSWAVRAGNLVTALAARYEATGEQAVLAEADALIRSGLTLAPRGSPAWVNLMSAYGALLTTRAHREDDPAVLSAAADTRRALLGEIPPGVPGRAAVANGLGRALLRLYILTEDRRLLGETVEAFQTAVDELPENHPERAGFWKNLAVALTLQSDTGWNPLRRRKARKLVRMAEAAVADEGVLRTNVLYTAALVTSLRPRDVPRTLRMLQTAAEYTGSPPGDRLGSAVSWAELARLTGDLPGALTAYRLALDLLPLLAPRTADATDQEYWLSRSSGLASNAAACALDAGDAVSAVELLEQGRGIMLSYSLDTGGDLDLLRAARPETAERFAELRRRITRVAHAAERSGDLGGVTALGLLQRLNEEWDALLGEIRALPGFAGFLRTPVLADLLPRDDSAVVMLTSAESRCDALVLTRGGVLPVPLPELDQGAVLDLRARVTTATMIINAGAEADLEEHLHAEELLRTTLRELWHKAALPVLTALGRTGPPPPDTLWSWVHWITCGGFAGLPVHAAQDPAAGDDACVLERVVSSYTPTARILQEARRTPARRPLRWPEVLIVGGDDTGLRPRIEDEIRLLRNRFPRSLRLRENETAVEGVLEALASADIAHFACRATSDPARPSRSRLLLAGGELTVGDLGRMRRTPARLAYLSACATAHVAVDELADEAVHVASAFQLAGFRGVIGTLWPIADGAAAALAADCYERLARNWDDPAFAVHEAVRRRREAAPLLVRDWAGLVHVGV